MRLGPALPCPARLPAVTSHACARLLSLSLAWLGEDEATIRPTLNKLHANGIGAILDYAAEDDSGGSAASRGQEHGDVVARTYDYETESACDRHKDIFLRSIMAAADAPGQGFAAIKVLGLTAHADSYVLALLMQLTDLKCAVCFCPKMQVEVFLLLLHCRPHTWSKTRWLSSDLSMQANLHFAVFRLGEYAHLQIYVSAPKPP